MAKKKNSYSMMMVDSRSVNSICHYQGDCSIRFHDFAGKRSYDAYAKHAVALVHDSGNSCLSCLCFNQ